MDLKFWLFLFFTACTAFSHPSTVNVPSDPGRDQPELKYSLLEKNGLKIADIVYIGEFDDVGIVMLKIAIQQSIDDKANSILLELDSPGGNFETGTLMAKALSLSGIPVSCYVDRYAASMGYFLLQTCNTRYSSAMARIGIHEPYIMGKLTVSLIEKQYATLTLITNVYFAIGAAKTILRAEEMADKCQNGTTWWISGVEAKKINAIDEIVPSANKVKEKIFTDLEAIKK